MSATDRVDNDSSLVRAPSHQPWCDGDLEPITSVRSHVSQHAHFAPEPKPERGAEGNNDKDLRGSPSPSPPPSPTPTAAVDIEHVPVDDDPRKWSTRKKNLVMALMTTAVLGPMISPSIYNPVVDQVKIDLNGTETEVGLSLSLYILFQGCVPVVWASTAEIIGRKPIYIASFILYTVGTAVGSRAPNMSVLIGMRCLQAMGSSAVLSVGAGSLADMYEVKERGRKLGLYYGMPMLGPTLGPLIGGALGNAYGWRSTMYFLAIWGFIMTLFFIPFPDTWRRERSRVYQKAISDAEKRKLKAEAAAERKRERKRAKGLASTATTPAETRVGTPTASGAATPTHTRVTDVEKAQVPVLQIKRQHWFPWTKDKKKWNDYDDEDEEKEIKPSFRDVNPLPTMVSIFKSPTNAFVLCSSGFLFAAQYTTTYTASMTFSRDPYHYNPLIVGVVLLSFGVGNIFGSVIGGRASDYIMKRLAAKNGGVTVPEMRLKSTLPGMPFIVASYLVFAWTCDFKTNIAGPVVALFFAGFSLMYVYSSLLAYLVDGNPGRSASAVSMNSFCRGVAACVMSQVALPIQNAIGDGGLYTLFAALLCLACAGLAVIAYRGEQWRSPDHQWPWSRRRDQSASSSPCPEKATHVTQSTAPDRAAEMTRMSREETVAVPEGKN